MQILGSICAVQLTRAPECNSNLSKYSMRPIMGRCWAQHGVNSPHSPTTYSDPTENYLLINYFKEKTLVFSVSTLNCFNII